MPDDIKNESNDENDEIDLRELFRALWAGKILISFTVFSAIVCASLYLHRAEQKFTVTYTFAPVESQQDSPNLGGLSGLASLAGISLPSSSSSDFIIFKFLLQSEEIGEKLLKDENLVKEIFEDEWDTDQQSFRQPPDGSLSPYVRTLKKLLTGKTASEYITPNAARLSVWLKNAFNASEDRDSGFLTLSSETTKPNLIMKVMAQATFETDSLLKERFIQSSEQTMSFYQTKLSQARAREHREALAKLIAAEDQKLMLVSKGEYFVAKPVTVPAVSLEPTSPKYSLVLALSVVLGSFLGAALVLFRNALR